MKRKKTINFLTIILFFGIVLSLTVYIGLGDLSEGGGERGGENAFNGSFFSDGAIGELVRYCDYKVFGHAPDSEIIVGENDWLFEATDSQNGYERLLDYIGGCPYDERELELIRQNVQKRCETYERQGTEYLLVIIPDAMTVCEDKVPSYLGGRSDSARLSQLTAYINEKGQGGYLDPTQALIEGAGELVPYNNTENSINAYGAYCIYTSAISRYLADTGTEVERLYREDVDFFVNVTEGLSVAKGLGLERTVRNRTVALSEELYGGYEVIFSDGGTVVTERNAALGEGGEVVIECSNEWDRRQLMPYFSNTFDRVRYKSELSELSPITPPSDARLVIQVIRESELDLLRN